MIEIVQSKGDDVSRGQLIIAGRLDKAVKNLEAAEQQFAEYLKELDERKKEVDNLKQSLYDSMQEEGVKKLQSEHLTITLVAPTVRETISVSDLKTYDKELYEKAMKVAGKKSDVKGYVRLKVKE